MKQINNKLHSEFWFMVISSEMTHQKTQESTSPQG